MSGDTPAAVRDFVCADEAATRALGAALASTLPPAPTGRALRVHLCGELGAGKTTLVRALLQTLGVRGALRSPTYALLECHEAGEWTGVHLDLYRLASPAELAELGLADFDCARHLWLIEWPERAAQALPQADLEIEMSVGRDAHAVRLRAASEIGCEWLSALPEPR